MQEQPSPAGTTTDQVLFFLHPATLALLQTTGGAQELFGYCNDRLCRMSLTDLVVEPSPEELRKRLCSLGDGTTELTLGVLLHHRSGRTIPAELLLARLASPEGQPITAVARVRGAQTKRDDAPRLEPGDRQYVDFASRLGHDMNNLLSTVIGSLGLIREDVIAASDDDDGRQIVDDALSAGRECADIVDRLMTAAGKQFLRPQRVAVNSIVSRLEPLLKQTLPDNIHLRVSLGAGIPDLDVDPVRLEAAILDLVVNAREAMPCGGELAINTGLGRALGARPALPPDRDYVQITVSDAGNGIPEQLRKRVLEPFFTTKSGGSGHGLGLSMVNGFVQQSQGALRLDSNADAGTRVTLNFPAAN
jgi:signal transduction histidine kinase